MGEEESFETVDAARLKEGANHAGVTGGIPAINKPDGAHALNDDRLAGIHVKDCNTTFRLPSGGRRNEKMSTRKQGEEMDNAKHHKCKQPVDVVK